MNRWRGPAGMITAWLMVVAVGSAMVWTVISRAGNNLLPTQDPSFQAAQTAQQISTVVPPEPSAAPPQQLRKPIVIKSVEPIAPPVKGVAPTETLSPTPTPLPPAPPSSPAVDEGDPHDGDGDDFGGGGPGDNGGEPVLIRGSWQGASGGVFAECEGWKIDLLGARANSGYDVEVETGGPRFVRVGFVDQASQEATTVTGNCRDGKPVFYARSDAEGGTGDTTN